MNQITSYNLVGMDTEVLAEFKEYKEEPTNVQAYPIQRDINLIISNLNFQTKSGFLPIDGLKLRMVELEKLAQRIADVEVITNEDDLTSKERIENQKLLIGKATIKYENQPSTSQKTSEEKLEQILLKGNEIMLKNTEILKLIMENKLSTGRTEKDVEIKINPFVWKVKIHSETPKNFQNDLFVSDLQSFLKELEKSEMTGIYKFALQIDVLFNLIQLHNLDPKRIISALSTIFEKGLVHSLLESKKTTEVERLEEILKRLFERQVKDYNKTCFMYIKELIEKQSMRDSESINSWLVRYKSCIKFLNMQNISQKDLVRYFIAGISSKWKMNKRNAMDLLEIEDKSNLDFYISEKEQMEEENYVTSDNFSHSNNNKKNELEEKKIYSIYRLIKEETSKKNKWPDQKKEKMEQRERLYIEMSSNRRNFRFLVDSGSPIHVIRKETLDKYNLKYFEKEINTFSGAAVNSKIEIIGTCKLFFRTGENKYEPIKFLVANNIAEDILSWQRLAGTFEKVMWVESKEFGRIIVLGSTQFTKGTDGTFRPLKKVDMQKVLEHINDGGSKSVENNTPQKKNPISIMEQTIIEQKKEIEELKKRISDLTIIGKTMEPLKEVLLKSDGKGNNIDYQINDQSIPDININQAKNESITLEKNFSNGGSKILIPTIKGCKPEDPKEPKVLEKADHSNKAKEKLQGQDCSTPIFVRKKIKKILDLKLDGGGKATFKCILVNRPENEPQWLTEKMIYAAKTIVDSYMKKIGYKRGENWTWNKTTQTLPEPDFEELKNGGAVELS